MSIAYDSEDCRVFAIALDHAWEIFLKTGKLTSANIDTAKAALTYSIFHAASAGERSPRRLAMAAVARVDPFHACITQERSWSRPGDTRGFPLTKLRF